MGDVYTIQYRYVEEFGLIVEKHVGAVRLEVLVKSMGILASKKEFVEGSSFLVDLRATRFNLNIERVKEFVEYMERNFPEALMRKIALIADESDQVAMATLFKMLQGNNSKNIHVFSTLEYALLWLNVESDVTKMERLIDASTVLANV